MKNLIILFLFIANLASAQTLLKGRVLNAADNSPLNYSHITVENKNISCWTDNNGFFSLTGNIGKDEFLLISHTGFETKRIMVESFQNSSSKDILLENNIITSQTILVRGSIGKEGTTPVSFSKIDQSIIKKTYTTQDIPEVLSYQPSVTFYSENGNGIGYNYMSIRGFDQRRISVAINGIPQNDPEDHNVYWINFSDLLESTELIQVQRGAGSGIVGYPAMGGSINIITSTFSDKPKVEFSSSLGSYNTRKYSAEFSSGLISDKYSIYAKLSQTLSSGYRNSSWTDLKSYYLSAVRYDENLTTQVNLYGGPIADGLAYTGLPKFAIKDKDLRRQNYSDWSEDNGQYTNYIERRPEEIENFSQPHFEILNELKLNKNISLNSALFLVLGDGFFDYDGSGADTTYFRLTNANGFHATQNPTSTIIRAMVENKQWGWIPRVSIKHDNGELIIGGEMRIHRSVHWGSIIYGNNLPDNLTENFRYYYYEGGKDILNFYVHENYNLSEDINMLAELQLSSHKYIFTNEKYLGNEFNVSNLFVNPRIGINYRYTPDLSLYFSFARVSREPQLTNYYYAEESTHTDGTTGEIPRFELNPQGGYDFSKPLVHPETMNDIEFGTSFLKGNVNLSLNVFYMLFNDEIVEQGQVDRFGQPITGNMDRTIHYGIEAAGIFKLGDHYEFVINGSAAKHYISRGITYANYQDTLTAKLDLAGNRISGFPDITFNALFKFNFGNFFAQLSEKYVGDLFTDNYGDNLSSLNQKYPGITDYPDNKVDSYFVTNFFASYQLYLEPVVKELKIFFQVNNLFDNLYAAYGIGKEFFPAAERNFLFGLKLGM